MSEFVASYLVAFSAMVFAALSAFTLITTVNHFDPPETGDELRKAA
jgi:hypothetical protein